jgi:hypothetical protein
MPGFDLWSTKNRSNATSDRPTQLGCTDNLDLLGIKPNFTKEKLLALKY